jgi:hypothetical protein
MLCELHESNPSGATQQQDHGDSVIQTIRRPVNQPFPQVNGFRSPRESNTPIHTPSDLRDSRFTYYVGKHPLNRGAGAYLRDVDGPRAVSDRG